MIRPFLRARGALALLLAVCSSAATAQVQRTFVNLGFELPSAGSSTCFFQVDESTVPGWTTNHPSQGGSGCAPLIAASSGKLIEIWTSGFNGVAARSGTQFAELNAEAAARIFQNVCLATGEPIAWRFSHRGRQSATVDDVAEFRVGGTAGVNQVVRAATQNDGGFTTPTCYNTGASSSGIADNSCSAPALSGTWRDYAGAFTWNGATGVQAIGFEAISAAGGATVGNFIDDIQVTLRPFVELSDAALSVREGGSGLPTLRVVGTVPAGGLSVTLQIQASSSATRGSDYTTAGSDDTVVVTVPAGVYDGNDLALPIALVDDAAIEDTEFLDLAIVSSPTNYVLSSTRTCGGTPVLSSRVSLIDNEVDLATTLQAPTSAVTGSTVTLAATFTHNTAAPTQGDTAARTADAAITLAPPAGLAFTGWTCTATHGAQCPGGGVNASVSGSGAISGSAVLPAGNAAAGGSLSYSIQAEVTADYCSAVALTASITTPAPLAEATSVQSGFVTPAPGGTASNSASATIAVPCANSPPVITTTAPTQATRGQAYGYDVDASDADHDVLAYNLDTQPAGMGIDAATGLITWTPGEDQVGAHAVSVRVTDGHGGSAVQSFTLTVIAVNRAPQITSTPGTVGVTGQAYAYAVSASDPDHDTLSYTLVQAPAGMVIDAVTGFVTWTPTDAQLAAADVIVQVSDPHGASDTQAFRVIVNASLIGRSHVGTAFWFLMNLNFYTCNDPALCIPADSPDRALSVTVAALTTAQGYLEIPGLSFRQDFALAAGEVATIALPWQAMHANPDAFQVQNKGIHVVADAPVTVVATNRAKHTTDAALIYPVDVLGTHYTAADYPTYSGSGGQLGVVALEDNTRVTFLDDAAHARALPPGLTPGQDWSITLQRGQSYSLSTLQKLSLRDPYSGMPIVASAPIAVFGGSTCADVPTNAKACDHLFEQLLPDRNLGQRFVAGTLATRTAGNMVRFVATQPRTAVYSGTQLIAVLDAGEAAERVLAGAVEIHASQPIHALLLAQSESVDSGQRTLPADIPPGGEDGDNELLDPFLIALPPVGTELTDYLFTTPQVPDMPLHYAGVSIAQSAAASLQLDGVPVTGVDWQPLPGGRVHGNVRVSAGRHRLQATAPFALVVYGYGVYESYGYTGGLMIGNQDRVRRIEATPLSQTRSLGDSACFSLVLRDEQGRRVPYARIGIALDGAWPRVEARFADGTGQGEYCFEQPSAGTTPVRFQSGQAQAQAEVTWLAPSDGINRAPVITSLPRLELHQEAFHYAIQALDPNGDALSYVLVDGPPGAQLDAQTGVLHWTAPIPADRRQQLHDLSVRVQDPQGLYAEQSFTLRLTFDPLLSPLTRQDAPDGGVYGENLQYLGDGLEAPTLIAAEAPAGFTTASLAPLQPDVWRLSWNPATSPALRYSPALQLGSRDGRFASAGFGTDTAWSSASGGIAVPVFGRPLDTNADGVVTASDRLVAAGIFASKLTLRYVDTGEALPGSGTRQACVASVVPAFVDLNGDGTDEIVYCASIGGNAVLAAVDGASQLRWPSNPAYGVTGLTTVSSSIESADLDGNGVPEIIAGGRVYNADGTLRWSFSAPPAGANLGGTTFLTPLIRDLDGDGALEVAFLNEVRTAAGTLRWRLPEDGLAGIAVGEFTAYDSDGDGDREVVAVVKASGADTWRLERLASDGTRLGAPILLAGAAGQPLVFDIDRDGSADIYLPRLRLAYAFDGSVRHRGTPPAVSDPTFRLLLGDVNGDGAVDEFSGGSALIARDLATRFPWHNAESTNFGFNSTWGAGAFVDVDGNGSAELFIGGGSNALLRPTHGNWPADRAGRRSLRDGEARFAGSVGLDIPPAAPTDLRSDAWIGDLYLRSHSNGERRYEVSVRNRGLKPMSAGATVSLYAGPRGQGGVRLASTSVPPLASNAGQTVLFAPVPDDDVFGWLYAYIDSAETTPEASLHNNQVASRALRVQLRDEDSAIAEQAHNVQVTATTPSLTLSGSLPAKINAGHPISVPLLVNRPDPDGAPVFSLGAAPRGVRVDPWSGVLSWTPTAADAGTRYITVTVSFFDGSTGSTVLSTQVVANPNRPPLITSTAPSRATAGALYQYPASATDPDNDTLSYALTGAPSGMSINASTGLVQWTPTTAQAGTGIAGTTYSPTLRVSDTGGNVVTQTFSVVAVLPAMQPPTFTTLPVQTARVGCAYVYAATAVQETGAAVHYGLAAKPTGMSVNITSGRIDWLPAAGQDGTHSVRLNATVTSSNALAYQQYSLSVLRADQALALDLRVDPPFAPAGATVTVSAAAVNAAGPATLSLTIDGQPVTLDAQGRATFTAGAAGAGHTITGSVSDACGTAPATRTVRVIDPSDTTPPVVTLTSPVNNAVITKPSDVIGTVSDDNLLSWRLALKDDQGSEAFRVIASGTNTFTNTAFATFDPTLLLNGLHILVLEATDTSGQVTFDSVAVSVEGDMKVGHYAITLLDVEIPLSGIPVRVTRTYDTRRAHEDLDFGYGWSVDYQNVRVRENRKLGFSWRLAPQGGGLSAWCVRPLSDPLVTITLPDGTVEKFTARFEPECEDFAPVVNGQLVFDPVGDTHSTLEQLSYGLLRVVEQGAASNLVDPDSPNEPADPSLYRLSTRDGLVYTLDQYVGIRTITDTAGNVITYDRSGVRHSNGRAVGFVRDAKDRITRITLPNGGERRYDYGPTGDLLQSTDAGGVVHSYSYLTSTRWPHYLEKISDAPPSPVVIARHEYDTDGRLVASVDGNGQRIEYTHNVSGQVEVVKNRRGHSTSYVYDDNGWVLSETNSLGEQTLHSYDSNGNALTTRDPEQRLTTRTYDARGNVLTETNNAGETVTRTYGYYNQLKTEHDAYNRQVLFNEYWFHPGIGQETGILIRSTDGLNRKTHYAMDVCGAAGNCGNSGNLTGLIDDAGGHRTFDYDRYGNLTKETDTQGTVTERDYDTMGRVLTETRRRVIDGVPQTLVTTNTYDDGGNLIRTIGPDGVETVNLYDEKGRRYQSVSAGVTRTYQFDDSGRVIGELGMHGDNAYTRYDAEGNVIETEDAYGNKTKMVYDAANRLIETILPDTTAGDADNPRTTQTYFKDSQLKTTTDERGHVTRYTYDDAGRQETVTHGQTPMSQSVYDTTGRRIASIDALERTTKYVYDVAGQLTQTILPDAGEDDHDDSNNLTVDYAYDRVGRKIAETDPAGRTTRYVHDSEGRLIGVVLPNPTTGENPIGIADALARGEYPAATVAAAGVLVTRYGYDEQGNKTQQIDALNRTTRWSYDNSGRVLRRTLPLGQFEQYAYTTKGLLDWHRDFNDQLTTFHYDSSNRLTTTRYADGKELVLTHDRLDRPLTLSHGGVTETRAYDERGRLSRVGWNDGQQIDYQYDQASNRTKVITPTRTLDFTFDALNRLSTVTEPPSVALGQSGAARITTYGYDAVGNRDHTVHANGTRVDYRYDRLNRLTNLTHRKGAAVLLALGYTLNPDGTRAAIAEHVQRQDGQGQYLVDTNGAPVLDESRTTSYAYDAVKRLTSEIVTSPNADKARTTTWVYDTVGNRLSQAHTLPGGPTVTAKSTTTSYQYDNNDRLLRETAISNGISRLTTHRYDLNGNLTETATPEQTTGYRYDGRNKLVQAERQIGSTLDISQHTYTADGIRRSQIQKAGTLDATEIRYLVDPNQSYAQVIEERVGAPLAAGGQYTSLNLKAAYTYGDDLLGQYALRDGAGSLLPGLPAGTGGNPLAAASTFHYDGLGSTRLLTDSAGNTIDAYTYGAFGEPDRQASLLQTADRPITDYQYTGEQHDPNLGFYNLRARYMNPQNGRFTQSDEFDGFPSTPDSLHKYLYASSSPINGTDPSGRFTLTEIGVASDIRSTLGNLQSDVGFNLIDASMNSESYSASSMGWSIVANMLPIGALPNVFRGMKWSRNGKVGTGYLRVKAGVKQHEIVSAERITELTGARVLHRGTGKGPDLLIDGVLWEMKTMKSWSKNTLDGAIRDGLQNWKAIGRNHNRIFIDGTDIGLTDDMFNAAMNNVRKSRINEVKEIRYIRGDGTLGVWP